MSESLSDRDLSQLLRGAGPLGELAASGRHAPAEIEKLLRTWHASPPDSADGLGTQQIKSLAIDRIRLTALREVRADASAFRAARDRIAAARGGSIAIISGAGISVDAGFRTFRGAAGEGLWERVDPMVLASTDGFEEDPERSMRWYCSRRTKGLAAVPTLAHAAIHAAEQAQAADWSGTHTQNVDGLHEAAGCRGVNRIHGSIYVWRDRRTMELVFDPSDDVADIPRDAAGVTTVRPGVVMFGDMVSTTVYERAISELRGADVVIVVGTSAQVSTLWPLLHTADHAARLLIDVNPEASPVTHEFGAAHIALPSGIGIPLVLEELGALDPETTERLSRTPRRPLREIVHTLGDELLRDDG